MWDSNRFYLFRPFGRFGVIPTKTSDFAHGVAQSGGSIFLFSNVSLHVFSTTFCFRAFFPNIFVSVVSQSMRSL